MNKFINLNVRASNYVREDFVVVVPLLGVPGVWLKTLIKITIDCYIGPDTIYDTSLKLKSYI